MKIEAGKYYKMRNGKKAYVAAKLPEDGSLEKFIGTYEIENLRWFEDGKTAVLSTNYYDLIEEWREPKKVKVDCWINVYPDLSYGIYNTRQKADGFTGEGRIACIHIEREITEGDGL